jgi:hypothetical protein
MTSNGGNKMRPLRTEGPRVARPFELQCPSGRSRREVLVSDSGDRRYRERGN